MKANAPNMRLRGSLAILFSASVWGLVWIPLRAIDQGGVKGFWAIALTMVAAMLIALPVALWRREFNRENIKWILFLGACIGASETLYFAGLILSDVVRVVLLFYLLPIWATLLSRILYNIPIGRVRLVAVGLALAGVWLLLGGGGWPVPQNIGDVFALASGLLWAIGLTVIREKNQLGSFAIASSGTGFALGFAVLLGFAFATLQPSPETALPGMDAVIDMALPILFLGLVLLWPSMIGQLWGARHVPATTAALLTMSEVLVATISSALLIGISLSGIAWIGGVLILMAVLLDLRAGDIAKSHL